MNGVGYLTIYVYGGIILQVAFRTNMKAFITRAQEKSLEQNKDQAIKLNMSKIPTKTKGQL